MWLIIQPCTPTVPAVPVPAVQYLQQQYLTVPGSAWQYQQQQIHSCVLRLANANNVIGTTYQHNTDTTMGITITDNLVDTTLYQDH